MSDSPKLNLRQKLVSVYDKIDHIEKSGYNERQRYAFIKAADMVRTLRAFFVEVGVYAETNFELLGTYDILTNKKDVMHTATVKCTIVLFDCDSDETKTISGLGDGADMGDKGIFKAQTGALKNALRNGALLPDEKGADPEADETVDANVDPEYREARHESPKAYGSGTQTEDATARRTGLFQPVPFTETQPSAGASDVAAPSKMENARDAPREPGDEPVDSPLPTEKELEEIRVKKNAIVDTLSSKKVLQAGKSMPIDIKVKTFLFGITKRDSYLKITKAEWDDFFQRVTVLTESGPDGWKKLATLINKANGIEENKK